MRTGEAATATSLAVDALPTLADLTPELTDAAAIRAHGLFDAAHYRARLGARGPRGDDLLGHYLQEGSAAGVDPHPLFSVRYYRSCHPDVAAAGIDPLTHYVRSGATEGRDPHPLFHGGWYRAQLRGDLPPGMTPLGHFLAIGAHRGLDPHPLFATRFYLRQRGGLAVAPENPLVHYLQHGWRQGLDPHPLFSAAFVAEESGGLPDGDVSPLERYVCGDAATAPDPHPLFSNRWYLERSPDVATHRLNPLVHFVNGGANEDRDPHPLFDVRLYRRRCGGVEEGVNPLIHFLEHGEAAGVSPHEMLDGAIGWRGDAGDASSAPSAAPQWLAGVGTAPPAVRSWVAAVNTMRPLPVAASDPRAPQVSVVFPVAARWTETLTAITSVRWHRNRRRYELVLVLPAGLEAAAIVGALTGVRTVVAPSGLLDLAWLSGLLRAEVVVLHDGRSPVGPGWLDEITTALALHPQAGEVTFDPPQRAAAALPAPDVDGRGNGAPPADRRPGIRALWRHQLGRAEAGGSFSVALSGGRAQAGPQRETRRTTGPEP